MLSVDEMRAITRHVKEHVAGAQRAWFEVEGDVITLRVKMDDGRELFDAINLANASPWHLEEAQRAWCDGIHQFVREERGAAAFRGFAQRARSTQ